VLLACSEASSRCYCHGESNESWYGSACYVCECMPDHESRMHCCMMSNQVECYHVDGQPALREN
jgi:hypothetical protein